MNHKSSIVKVEIGYIEPCCAERQLPPLLQAYPMVAFQTNGDVTFITIMKAVSWLAGNRIDITLVVPEVDVEMLRVFEWFGRRGWLASATILTAQAQTKLIKGEITTAPVKAYHHKAVTDPMVVISGEDGVVVVQGPLLSKPRPGFRCFTAARGAAGSPVIRMCTATLRALINVRSRDKNQD